MLPTVTELYLVIGKYCLGETWEAGEYSGLRRKMAFQVQHMKGEEGIMFGSWEPLMWARYLENEVLVNNLLFWVGNIPLPQLLCLNTWSPAGDLDLESLCRESLGKWVTRRGPWGLISLLSHVINHHEFSTMTVILLQLGAKTDPSSCQLLPVSDLDTAVRKLAKQPVMRELCSPLTHCTDDVLWPGHSVLLTHLIKFLVSGPSQFFKLFVTKENLP